MSPTRTEGPDIETHAGGNIPEAGPFRFRADADPSISLAIRAFAGACLDETAPDRARDDVRLVATELLAAAIDSGATIDLTVSPRSDGWELTARGVGALLSAPLYPALAVRRLDILSGIADVHIDQGSVACRGTYPQSTGP